jgi:CRP-like cAMP-binding protein
VYKEGDASEHVFLVREGEFEVSTSRNKNKKFKVNMDTFIGKRTDSI